MKKFLKYNIPAAVTVLVLVIALSVVGGVNRTASSLAGELSRAYSGESGAGTGRFGDISASVGVYLDTAFALAELTGDAGLESALSAGQALTASPFGDRDAFARLSDAAGAAYHALIGSTDEQDARRAEAKTLFSSLEAAKKRLADCTEYNDAAERYNRTVSSFPGRFLVFGKSEAVVFH